jgi:hypothetical protein
VPEQGPTIVDGLLCLSPSLRRDTCFAMDHLAKQTSTSMNAL